MVEAIGFLLLVVLAVVFSLEVEQGVCSVFVQHFACEALLENSIDQLGPIKKLGVNSTCYWPIGPR